VSVRGISDASGGLSSHGGWLVPLHFQVVGGNVAGWLVLLTELQLLVTQAESVTVVHVDFGRVVVVRQLIFADSSASKSLAPVGVIEVSIPHKGEAFLAEAGVRSVTSSSELALLLSSGHKLCGTIHLGVVGL